MDANDQPVVTYYYKNSGDLRMASFNGSSWVLSTLATTGDVGRYSSLKMNDMTNKFGVAYEDDTHTSFMFAEQRGTGWLTSTADVTKYGGGYISLEFNGGLPAISYYDAFNSDLKFAERSSRNKWTVTTVAAKNSQGLYTNLAFTYNTNQPAIVYYNKTADSVMLGYRNTDNTWSFETDVTGGGRNVTPADGASINGQAPDLYMIYTDSATGGLKVKTV